MAEYKVLDNMIGKRSNNQSFIRFIAAILVIIWHSFCLCGVPNDEIFYRLSGYELSFGRIATSVFLFSSGFFIARSIEKKNRFKEYFKTRAMRIFPLLVIVVLLSVVMGLFVTSYTKEEYLTNVQTYKYLLNGVLVLQHNLPGVFENNIYGQVVNGSLWTLPVEFLCYIVCFICFHIGIMKRKIMVYTVPVCIFGALGVLILGKKTDMSVIVEALGLCIIFYIGMLYYVFRDKICFSPVLTVIITAVLVCSIIFRFSWIGVLAAFPYYLSYIFFMKKQVGKRLAGLGDYSYAMYLCAFPIQQLAVSVSGGNMNPYMNIAVTLPIIILLSVLLHYIETIIYRCVMG